MLTFIAICAYVGFFTLMVYMLHIQLYVLILWSLEFDRDRIGHSFGKKGFLKELRNELERSAPELVWELWWLCWPLAAASWIFHFLPYIRA